MGTPGHGGHREMGNTGIWGPQSQEDMRDRAAKVIQRSQLWWQRVTLWVGGH